jgi:glycosyltransferase involved in cell wall biosynthesis
MKIVLAHPGVGPFVQQTARALFEAGLLASYWTTFADQPEARWRSALIQLASLIGADLEQELGRRAVREVPAYLLRRAPFWEIIRSLLTKMRSDRRIVDLVWEHEIFSFDRGVSERGLDNATGVYGYEYSALGSFQEAEKRGLARIYEVPSPEHDFVEDLIQREIEQFPELDDGRRKYFLARQARRTERRRREWAMANLVIANSTFTRDSYAAAGLDVSKVHVIPLGAPPVREKSVEGGHSNRERLCVLWAGSFSVRKGAHYLLSAWKQIASENAATLDIYGAVLLPERLLRSLPASIRFHSTIPHVALFDQYHKADVLVFPTLCDGFGMVVTEAFSQGLPVITTMRAGAADLVRHGENGLIVPAGDAEALAEALEWCLTHRIELNAMRRAALETAARWQWHDYRLSLAGNVIDGLRGAGYAA